MITMHAFWFLLIMALSLLTLAWPLLAEPQGGWLLSDWVIKDDVNEIADGAYDLCNVFCRVDGQKLHLKITTRTPLTPQVAVQYSCFDAGGQAVDLSAGRVNASMRTFRGVQESSFVLPVAAASLERLQIELVNVQSGEIVDAGSVNLRERSSLENEVGNCAFVHHGNQGLTYTNVFRGTGGTNGFDEILELHELLGVPGNFHMSGTLITAAEWYDPTFNQWLRNGISAGWAGMLTSAYAQHIMPFVTNEMNNWAVNIEHDMVQTVYNYHARVAWIPERVWLACGHYPDAGLVDCWLGDNWTQHGVDAVLLDDWPHVSGYNDRKIHWMNNGMGINLRVIPIDGEFTGNCHFNPGAAIAQINSTGRYGIVVYGTDWEAAAELADFNCPNCLENYSQVVTWAHDNYPAVGVWKLDSALDNSDFNGQGIEVGNGTYGLIGGFDGYGGSNNSWYTHWAGTASLSDHHVPPWNYGTVWTRTYNNIIACPSNNLSESAWYVMMTNLHETAWHDYMGGPISGWQHRYSAHIKNANPYANASRWAAGEYAIPVNAYFADADSDGVSELVIHNDRVMAVFESIGGRAQWVFAREDSGYNYSIVGSCNTYWAETDGDYDEPNSNNHQAAFADVSPNYRNNLYSMFVEDVTDTTARIRLAYGTVTKTISVRLGDPFFDVRYEVGPQTCYLRHGITPDLIDLIWNADMQRVWAPDVSYMGFRNPHTGATGAAILGNGGAQHQLEFGGTLLRGDELRGYDRFGFLFYAGETSAPDSQGRIAELEALKTRNLDHFGPRLNAQAVFIGPSTIEVVFDEAVDLTTSQNPANWSLQDFAASYSVLGAARQTDWRRVRLSVTPNLLGGDDGTITAGAVTDVNGNLVLPSANTATLFVPSGLTPHTVVVDGVKDFDLSSEILFAGSDTLVLTWDSLALYIGYWNRDLATANFLINLDVNQLAGSGAPASSRGSFVQFANPFRPEYQLYIDGGPDNIELNRWTGSSWQYRTYGSHTATSYNGWTAVPVTEVRIPFVELGSPTGLALSVHVNNQSNASVLRAFPPANPIGNPVTLSHVYRFYPPYISGPMPLMGVAPRNVLTGDLAAPSNVVIFVSDSLRRLIWSAVPQAAGYVIYRAATVDGTYESIGETALTQFDLPLAPELRGFYRVHSKAGI